MKDAPEQLLFSRHPERPAFDKVGGKVGDKGSWKGRSGPLCANIHRLGFQTNIPSITRPIAPVPVNRASKP
jgi:hypothetical protein